MAIQLTFPNGAALVAGGTGTVGEGIVRRFAAADVPTYFTYLSSAEPARALEAELRSTGAEVTAVRMDLADSAAIDAVLADAVARHAAGGLALAINDAGATPAVVSLRLDQALEALEDRA